MKYLILVILSLLSLVLFGQDAPAEVIPQELNIALTFLGTFMGGFVTKYPWLGDALGWMLTARLIIKPIMSAISTAFKDSEIGFLNDMAKFSDNKIYKILAFVLDWVFSLKLPKKPVA